MSDIFELLEIKVPLEDLPASHFSCLVELLEEMPAYSKADLGSLNDFTSKSFHEQIRKCEESVRRTVLQHSKTPDKAIQQAYALGKLALAQELTATAYLRRADDTFAPIVLQSSNRKLVKAMLAGEKSLAELMAVAGRTQHTVATKLNVLRGLGAVETRSNGREAVFFLTHPAQSLLKANRVKPLAPASA